MKRGCCGHCCDTGCLVVVVVGAVQAVQKAQGAEGAQEARVVQGVQGVQGAREVTAAAVPCVTTKDRQRSLLVRTSCPLPPSV
jgi:hypothetical protein